jgi:hypothetical protein
VTGQVVRLTEPGAETGDEELECVGHRIAYSNLVSRLPFESAHSHALADILGEISAACAEGGDPMLSVLAVYISSESQGEPGPGVYSAAMSQAGSLRTHPTTKDGSSGHVR